MNEIFDRDLADDELQPLFDRTPLRPRPRAAAEAAALEALHGEWQAVVRKRRRRRMTTAFALAAGVVLTIATVVGVTTRSAGPFASVSVATVVRVEGGQARALDATGAERPITVAGRLFAGQQLATSADSRLALAWSGGGSLRVDEHTRVELVSARAVRLVSGGVYFDSAGARSDAVVTPAPLSIETPIGEVVHLGTQFMMSVEGDQVVVSVREGRVTVMGDGFELTVSPGEQLELDTDGLRSRRAIASHDESWRWAGNVAPRELIDGRSVLDVLGWVARETGRRLEYATTDAERLARETIIRGLGERGPEDSLIVLPYLTDLEYEIRADAIVLRAVAPQQVR